MLAVIFLSPTMWLPTTPAHLFMPTVHSCRVHLARVARDETGRVQLSTLLPRALNLHEATVTGETRDPLTRASQTAQKVRP